jgi:hypothetical protein
MKKVLLAFLVPVLLLLNGQARAATFAEKNLTQLVTEAEQIFVGTVSALQSRKLPSGAIVTDVRLSDLQLIKGSNQGADIVLLVLGGEVDGLRLEIPGLPQFQPGVRYLVFSLGNGKDMFPVVGGPGGLFQIQSGAAAGSSIVLSASGMPLAPGIRAEVLAGTSQPAQDTPQSPLTLEQFLAAVKARLGPQ